MPSLTPGEGDALVVVDAQNDFCPGGALAVPDGAAIMAVANRLGARFPHLVLTQDWHPPRHISFASSHPGRQAFETIQVAYGDQVLWPDHCVHGTRGAELHPDLETTRAALILRKGNDPAVDSYSAFYENDHRTSTGLAGYLRERDVKRLFLAGLATDFCVLYSALDARREGFTVAVVQEAVRGIDLQGSLARAWERMREAGVLLLREGDLG